MVEMRRMIQLLSSCPNEDFALDVSIIMPTVRVITVPECAPHTSSLDVPNSYIAYGQLNHEDKRFICSSKLH